MKQKPHSSPQAQATRQRLIIAAGQQLVHKGYAGATTRSIAEAAGVSELTLFRHFPTKKDLFSALFQIYSPLKALQAGISSPLSGEIRQDLITICRLVYSIMVEHRVHILMTIQESEGLEELRVIISDLPRKGRQMLAGYLQMQMARGVLQTRDPILSAQSLIGMFLSYIVTQSMLDEPVDESPQVVETFVDIFLNGMLVR